MPAFCHACVLSSDHVKGQCTAGRESNFRTCKSRLFGPLYESLMLTLSICKEKYSDTIYRVEQSSANFRLIVMIQKHHYHVTLPALYSLKKAFFHSDYNRKNVLSSTEIILWKKGSSDVKGSLPQWFFYGTVYLSLKYLLALIWFHFGVNCSFQLSWRVLWVSFMGGFWPNSTFLPNNFILALRYSSPWGRLFIFLSFFIFFYSGYVMSVTTLGFLVTIFKLKNKRTL